MSMPSCSRLSRSGLETSQQASPSICRPSLTAARHDSLGNVQAGTKRCSRPNKKIAKKRRTEWPQIRYPDPKTSPLHETGASPECHTISTVPRFQPPPRRTQRADFPHCALLFASPQGLWDLSCWGDFRHRPPNLVAVVQPQRFVQPLRTPPLPAEALPVPGPRHVAPDLLLHPVFNEAEALAGISHRKVSGISA